MRRVHVYVNAVFVGDCLIHGVSADLDNNERPVGAGDELVVAITDDEDARAQPLFAGPMKIRRHGE